jgi:hypothetical protein
MRRAEMNRVSLVLLALATALATNPIASASTLTYDFAFASSTSNATNYISGSGAFTVNSVSNAITGVTGNIKDTIDGLTVPIDYLLSTPGDTLSVQGGTYTFDNKLTAGALDSEGVYFAIDGSGDTVLLTDDTVHIFFPATGTSSAGADTRSLATETITPVLPNTAATPEPGSLVLLGTGLLCLAFIISRKAKPAGIAVNA